MLSFWPLTTAGAVMLLWVVKPLLPVPAFAEGLAEELAGLPLLAGLAVVEPVEVDEEGEADFVALVPLLALVAAFEAVVAVEVEPPQAANTAASPLADNPKSAARR